MQQAAGGADEELERVADHQLELLARGLRVTSPTFDTETTETGPARDSAAAVAPAAAAAAAAFEPRVPHRWMAELEAAAVERGQDLAALQVPETRKVPRRHLSLR